MTSRKVQDALQERFEFPVELAMNYAKPTIAGALERLQNAGVTDLSHHATLTRIMLCPAMKLWW